MTTSIKTCFKCNTKKPLTDFYRHKYMADGHLNKCKSCTENDAHKHRHSSEHREKVLAYDRARGGRQDKAYRDKKREQNPDAYKARNAVNNAIRGGRIVRPDRCRHCHKQCKPHGHHPDYERPLDVVWLCAECHQSLHALMETVDRELKEAVRRYEA